VELVARHPPHGPIVDVGGGNGYVAHGLCEAGFPAIVLEPGAAGARNALRRGLAPVINATLEAASFRAQSLPAIGLFDVLEHIDDARAFLEQAAALLEPGGRLYATVPAYMQLWSSEDVAAGHVRRYTRTGLCRELRDSGLTVDYVSYFFTPLPAPILLLRALPDRLGIARANHAGEHDHARREPVLRPLLDAALLLERRIIRRGYRLPLGASILVAARKAGNLS
jgi:SAM-dependent methyltransferase